MATRTAVKTGNWSDPTVWDSDPVLPGAGDVAECATYTVTIDQDVAVTTLRSSGAGYFAVTAARTITAAVLSNTGHSGGGVVRCSHAAGTVSITGSVTAGPSRGVQLTGAGTLNITGDVTAGSSNSAYGVYANNGQCDIAGNVTGGSALATQGVRWESAGTLTVAGSVTGGSASSSHGVYNSVTGTVNITGNVMGGSVGWGAINNSSGTITVAGIVRGGTGVNALGLHGQDVAGLTVFKRVVFGDGLGAAISGYVKLVVEASANYCEILRSDTGAAYQLSNDYPTAAQVESGVVYKLGTLTGELAGGGRRPRLWSM